MQGLSVVFLDHFVRNVHMGKGLWADEACNISIYRALLGHKVHVHHQNNITMSCKSSFHVCK